MITVATLNDLSAKMKAAPRVENLNRKIDNAEALQKLVPSMKVMLANGYETEQIVDILDTAGLRVSPRILSRLLKPQPATKPKQRN